MEVQLIDTRNPRSTFVDVLAWTFIVIAGFSALVCLPHGVVINTLFPPGPLPASADSGAQALSPATRFLVEHLRALLTVLFVASGATLVAAIGLLRRRNWARVTLIAILGLGVAANLAALVIPSFVSLSVPGAVPTQSAAFDANVHWMISVLRAFLSFFAIAVSGLFAWLIRRLHSRSIRAEFS